jgi:hypothetical protein
MSPRQNLPFSAKNNVILENFPIFVITNPGLDSVTGFNEYLSETPTFLNVAHGARIMKKTSQFWRLKKLAPPLPATPPPPPAKKATQR